MENTIDPRVQTTVRLEPDLNDALDDCVRQIKRSERSAPRVKGKRLTSKADVIVAAIQFWLDCGAPGSDLSEETRKEIASIVRESKADKNSAPRGRKVRKSA